MMVVPAGSSDGGGCRVVASEGVWGGHVSRAVWGGGGKGTSTHITTNLCAEGPHKSPGAAAHKTTYQQQLRTQWFDACWHCQGAPGQRRRRCDLGSLRRRGALGSRRVHQREAQRWQGRHSRPRGRPGEDDHQRDRLVRGADSATGGDEVQQLALAWVLAPALCCEEDGPKARGRW